MSLMCAVAKYQSKGTGYSGRGLYNKGRRVEQLIGSKRSSATLVGFELGA